MRRGKKKKQPSYDGPKRAAIYARVSSDRQAERETPIEGQLSEIRAYIEREGLVHMPEYEFTDEGRTGRNDIRLICQTLPDTLISLRTKTLLLIGFAGGYRRSELVSLDVEDVTECTDGLRILLRHSKTDTTGEGRVVGIPYGSYPETCPVRTYKAWLEHSGITTGAIFRGMDKGGRLISDRLSGRAVAQIIQKAAINANLPHKHVAGHSLRSGHVTSAARAGVPERVIMKQTHHRSERMVRRYIREGELFSENSATRLGL